MDRNSEQTEAEQESKKIKRQGYEVFHDGELGRCPKCGRLIMLPCLARKIKNIEIGFEIVEEKGVLELELRGNEQIRYQQLRAYRERHGISMLEGFLANKLNDQVDGE